MHLTELPLKRSRDPASRLRLRLRGTYSKQQKGFVWPLEGYVQRYPPMTATYSDDHDLPRQQSSEFLRRGVESSIQLRAYESALLAQDTRGTLR